MKIIKPKFWDLKETTLLSNLLLPFTLPLIINNYLLIFKKKRETKEIKTICLGNIYIGGTGKTPLTIKLDQILKELNFKTATIKKFYSDQVDEQKLLANKSKLYCHKNRFEALKNAIKDNVDVAIFDDGLQDRYLKYDISFVCFNDNNWIGNGRLIPSGPLREKLKSISKYDAIFLNSIEEKNFDIYEAIKKVSKSIKIFSTYYKPTNIHQFNIHDNYLAFSGIGNPSNFIRIQRIFNNDFFKLKKLLSGYSFSDKMTEEAVKEIYKIKGYVSEPHGAIGFLGLKEFFNSKEEIDEYQGIFLETAHPVKFKSTVEGIIKTDIKTPKSIQKILDLKKNSFSISKYSELKRLLLSN